MTQRVLLIDNELDITNIIKITLELQEFEVMLTITHMTHCQNLLLIHIYDLLLLDFKMSSNSL